MKVFDALKIEDNRCDEDANIIHLFKHGMFYRAYNWSAWLITLFLCTDENRLAILCKKYNGSSNETIFVGFPVSSIEKFIPNQIGVIYTSENQVDIEIDLPKGVAYNDMVTQFEEWKNQIKNSNEEIKPNIKNKNINTIPRDIMIDILSYPLEAKTQIENIEFISKLKRQLLSLI